MLSESWCFWWEEEEFSWWYRQQTLLMTMLKSKNCVPCPWISRSQILPYGRLRNEQINSWVVWRVPTPNPILGPTIQTLTKITGYNVPCLVLGVTLLWQDPRIVLVLLWCCDGTHCDIPAHWSGWESCHLFCDCQWLLLSQVMQHPWYNDTNVTM